MKKYVYDYEVYCNFFSGVFIDTETEELKIFVVHESRDDRKELIKFLSQKIATIGYNSFDYDRHFTQEILLRKHKWKTCSVPEFTSAMKDMSNALFDGLKRKWIPERKLIVPDLDLMRMWHFNQRSARATSLKKLEFNLRWPRLQDLPIDPDATITDEQVEIMIDYNINDVMATYEFYKRSDKEIQLRREVYKTYGINCFNMPSASIGQEIIVTELAKYDKRSLRDLKKLRTHREKIHLGDCIVPYVKFKDPKLKKLHGDLASKTIRETKGAFKYAIHYGGLLHKVGTGGLHSIEMTEIGKSKDPYTAVPSVWTSDDEYQIILVDVSSYYPNLSIVNKFFPAHFGPLFCEVYEDIYKRRLKHKKAGNKIWSDALKLSLNGAYGKSKDENSCIYDPSMTMSITINGQLLLLMLIEAIHEAGITLVQANTDGVMVYIKKDRISELRKIADKWENLTGLKLDFDYFDKIVQADINNYFGKFSEEHHGPGRYKYKGRFELKKDWHKDHSSLIIPKAVTAHFLDGVDYVDYIKSATDPYDFFIMAKPNSPRKVAIYEREGGKLTRKVQQKVVRYMITKTGSKMVIVDTDTDKETSLNSGYYGTIYNDVISDNIEDYDVDYNYYIAKVKEEVNHINKNNQLTLFK